MTARYRSEYPGEFVILETRWAGGRKHETREWIPNPIENQHISGRAACIGSSIDRWQFDYTRLSYHRGGLLGSLKLQLYGTGEIALDMRLDFAVETNQSRLQQLKQTGYQVNNIVYTTSINCVNNPGDFYLIPNRPLVEDMIVAPYLACFDGHREVFLLGYNNETPRGRNTWESDMLKVFMTYPIDFYLIGERTQMPESWMDCSRVRHMTYHDWVSYCDISQ